MRLLYCFISAFILVTASIAVADPVELQYDHGQRAGYFNQTEAGDVEGVRFTPAHPCSLLSFRFSVEGTGVMEWHVWGDNGGNMPDIENDLIEPFEVDVEDDNDWIVVDVSEAGLHFDVPCNFHIGYVKQDDEPYLYVDGGDPFQTRSFLRIDNTWYVTGDGSGNYLLRATVEYYNQLEEEDFTFHNVSEDAGIGGMSKMAWGDYDNDGWEDLLVNGRTLYRNLHDGTFENVSEASGITQHNISHSATWGDYDNDGNLDFYGVSNDHNLYDQLWHSNGDGTFSQVQEDVWLFHGSNPTAACGWGDADNDGCLDLYIANSEDWNDGNPVYYRDYFFHFDPIDRIFLDITPADIARNRYYGRSAAWCDFDMDGDMDFYVSNYRLQPNYLMVNQGDLEFENQAGQRGVAGVQQQGAYGHTIGSAWADYDNDGDFDLFAANLAHPRFIAFSDKCMLYRCSGAPDYTFEDVREEAGITYDETASSPAWGDYDNDGWLDIFITSVYDGRQPYFYRSNGGGTFTNVNYPTGFHNTCNNTWGLTWCDYDHDGDLDLAVGGGGGLFHNSGNDGNWMQLVLRGVNVNKFAFGCYAQVFSGDQKFLRHVEGASGTESCQPPMTLHYGLGEIDHIDSLVVTWVGQGVDRYYDLPVNRRYTAIEGEGLLNAPQQPDDPAIPSEFTLESLYPNPFNPDLNISFSLGESGRIKIDVYDAVGRYVENVVNKSFIAGSHTVSWKSIDRAAGSYVVQVKHNGGVSSRMVALVK